MENPQNLTERLMAFVRESSLILGQDEVERIMVEELRAMGYTVTKNGAGGYDADPDPMATAMSQNGGSPATVAPMDFDPYIDWPEQR